MAKLASGTKVRFTAPLSNGGRATWTATVIKIVDDVAYVRHPQRARTIPFSPVPLDALYKYSVDKLEAFVMPTERA